MQHGWSGIGIPTYNLETMTLDMIETIRRRNP